MPSGFFVWADVWSMLVNDQLVWYRVKRAWDTVFSGKMFLSCVLEVKVIIEMIYIDQRTYIVIKFIII